MKSRILVIDDETLMREFLFEALTRAGHEVETCSGGREGITALEEKSFDVLVTDLKMTPMSGLEVVKAASEVSPQTVAIVMTAYGTIETAVAALKSGAEDYILKPFAPDELELVIQKALAKERLEQENAYLRAENNRGYDLHAMIGQSDAMHAVYEQIQKVAGSRATVLIRGESGTGKELVARAIHYGGPRRDKPFVKVNCAALSAGLLESELFGHEKGSFTGAHERKIGRFELADGGTLLLDEISEINTELQPKLLRALQEREIERVGGTRIIPVDTRIVATSNRALEEAVEDGTFREDLFYRLNVIAIHLPPVRRRKEDIPLLMEHFLRRYAKENGRHPVTFSQAAQDVFLDYDWPGNVRELQNAIERAVVLSNDPVLQPEHFSMGGALGRRGNGNGTALAVGTTVAEMERKLIVATLQECGQNRTQAAKVLGISVRTLRNKLNEYQSS
jgi:DNA-binding NtrC family response regulator